MSVLAGISEISATRPQAARHYENEGRHTLEVKATKTNDPKGGKVFFVVEATIIDTDNENLRAGDDMNVLITKGTQSWSHDKFLKDVKACLAAICNGDEDEVTDEFCAILTEEPETLAGSRFEVLVKPKVSKNGKEYMSAAFSAILD